MTAPFDVIVVGLGGMGSAAAAHLARRGCRALGLERFTAGHDRGSSHGGPRIIRLAYFEDSAYVPLLRRAYELWQELDSRAGAAGGFPALVTTGGLMIGPPTSRAVAGARRSAAEWGLDHEMLEAREVRRRFPTLAPDDGTVALYEPVAGLVRADVAVAAHQREAAAAGADLRFGEAVTGWEAAPGGEGVTVRTGRGAYEAGHLVLCPGAWAPAVCRGMTLPLRAERHLHTWFSPTGGVDAFRPDRHPVWLWEPEDGTADAGFNGFAYGFPAVDGPGGGVKINVVGEPPPVDPDAVERAVSEAEVEVALAVIRRRLAVDPGPLLRAEVCLFENSPDHHFVVGPHPAFPQVTVAAGFSGHGFKFVPVIGEVLADLAVDGSTAHPIGLFAPGRL